MNDHEARISRLEDHILEFERRLEDNTRGLARNTKVTESIKTDTAAIVELMKTGKTVMKGGRFLGRVSAWIATILGGYLAGKGLKWW